MYIGPWQEYNLSKARARPNAAANTKIKNGLEEAIAKTLDPLAAQAAIAAVENFFTTQAAGPSTAVLQPLTLPSNSVPQRPAQRLPPRHKRGGRKHLPSLNNRAVQSAHSMSSSDSSYTVFTDTTPIQTPNSQHRGNDVLTPISVRSTQSEPLPARLPAISHNMTIKPMYSPHHHPPTKPEAVNHPFELPHIKDANSSSSIVSGYNANAVVNMLKLQKRQAISKVTGWQSNTPAVDIVMDGLDNNLLKTKRKLDPIERDKEKKLEQIGSMRQTYLQQDSGGAEIASAQQQLPKPVSTFNVKVSNANVILDSEVLDTIVEDESSSQIPSTPQIQSINLTAHELNLVSKYFSSSGTSSASNSYPQQYQSPIKNSKGGGNGIGFGSPRSPGIGAIDYNHQVSTPMTAASGTAFDELHVGGIDGLLKWSSQLDYDSIM